jgi:hypothetical protein
MERAANRTGTVKAITSGYLQVVSPPWLLYDARTVRRVGVRSQFRYRF